MLKAFLENYWHYLLFFAIILLAAWSNHRRNRDADRKGQNPRSIHFSSGRNSFRKEPEQTYTEDRRINRHWEP